MLKAFKNNQIISMRKGISLEGKGNSSSISSSDTTLFKTEVRQKLKHKKRKVIMDRDISPSLYNKLKLKCLESGCELKQKDVIEILYPLNISNITIARIINELVPNAKATQGSVASMIRFIKDFKSSKQLANELENLLDYEL